MKYTGNFTQKQPKCSNGESFDDFNLYQETPTELFKGIKGLTFSNGNLVNCILPEDAVIKNCNTSHVTFDKVAEEKKRLEDELLYCDEKIQEFTVAKQVKEITYNEKYAVIKEKI